MDGGRTKVWLSSSSRSSRTTRTKEAVGLRPARTSGAPRCRETLAPRPAPRRCGSTTSRSHGLTCRRLRYKAQQQQQYQLAQEAHQAQQAQKKAPCYRMNRRNLYGAKLRSTPKVVSLLSPERYSATLAWQQGRWRRTSVVFLKVVRPIFVVWLAYFAPWVPGGPRDPGSIRGVRAHWGRGVQKIRGLEGGLAVTGWRWCAGAGCG